MRGKRTVLASVGLLIGLGVLVAAIAATPLTTTVPDVQLRNQRGEHTRLADLSGRTTLLTFLYTSCPDTCPIYLSNLRAALAGTDDRPAVVVVTVDPDRDTVERLAEYAASWPADWLFLTGPYQDTASVWEHYGVAVRKRPPLHSSEVRHGYSVEHDAKLFVVGPDGATVAELTGLWTAADLVATLVRAREGTTLPASPFAAIDRFIRRCGDLAAARPELFIAIVATAALPGLLLPLWLLWTFLRENESRADPGPRADPLGS